MPTPPDLTDRPALQRMRARAARAPADFLRRAVIAELQERLIEVNRTFTAPALISPRPDLWDLPGAKAVPDAEVLDLDEGAHDLVIHDLCLHWANDPVGQLVQCRRALRPDGLLLATLFGGQTLWQLRAALAEAEAALTGGLSPRVAPMGEIRDLGGLMQRAGLALPVADMTPFDVTYPDALALMRDLRAMGEGNVMATRARRPAPRALFAATAAIYAESFGDGGRIPARFEVVTLTAWAPSADQPRPLRPGTATHRLAEALRVPELPFGAADD